MVGSIPGVGGREDKIFKIKRILILNLKDTDPNLTELNLDACPLHHTRINNNNYNNNNSPNNNSTPVLDENLSPRLQTAGAVQKTWNSIKSSVNVKQSRSNFENAKDKKLFDEILKMFNNSDSFYYSYTGDLSNTLQRKSEYVLSSQKSNNIWANYDDRFIWNKYMIDSLLENCDSHHLVSNLNYWIVPVIQGFFQHDTCSFDFKQCDESNPLLNEFRLVLISRRSRFRQGTRYKRRGLDENGYCANYVETEQIFKYGTHVVSFTQVRGSIPLFWSQTGHSYRPPPKVEKTLEENAEAFALHFEKELAIYKKEVIVNLVEKNGREKVIGETYLDHVINLDSPNLTYISFDFHEHW